MKLNPTTSPLRIGLLKCDTDPEPLRSEFGEQEHRATALLKANDPTLDLPVFAVCRGEYPQAPDDCDGYVCLGAATSVNGPEAWIHELELFTRELDRQRIPMVGICFGHQMIARALGGECQLLEPASWGHGILPFGIDVHETWMDPELREGQLIFSHNEQVTRLPEGAAVLGSSPHCPNALVRFRQHFLGIQAHPEMSARYMQAMFASRDGSASPGDTAATPPSPERTHDGSVVGAWMLRFLAAQR